MEKINLWESANKNNYLFFTDIESFFKYLDDNNLPLLFTTKDTYNPNDIPENTIDNSALVNNIEMTYTDIEHPIAIDKQIIDPSFINPLFF